MVSVMDKELVNLGFYLFADQLVIFHLHAPHCRLQLLVLTKTH
jgi:hypothetical protein